jgi:hypothetical protein
MRHGMSVRTGMPDLASAADVQYRFAGETRQIQASVSNWRSQWLTPAWTATQWASGIPPVRGNRAMEFTLRIAA